jgi:hypothetical protein
MRNDQYLSLSGHLVKGVPVTDGPEPTPEELIEETTQLIINSGLPPEEITRLLTLLYEDKNEPENKN